ncbi:MAG TPA: LysE family translocator [Rickettsiales bacterium]|nr:LysE family translocator [Rickettsiales bacterium]
MTASLLTAFSIYALVALLTPGPNNIMLLTSGLHFGMSRTVPHMAGVVGGFMLMVILVGLGLGAVFTAYPQSYLWMQYAAAAYLLYLAWKIATSGPMTVGQEDEDTTRKPMSFLSAAMFQWVNPKAWIIVAGAVSLYAPHEHYLLNVLIIAFIFGVVGVPSVAVWAAFGSMFRKVFSHERYMKPFNWCMALMLVLSIYPTLKDIVGKVIG